MTTFGEYLATRSGPGHPASAVDPSGRITTAAVYLRLRVPTAAIAALIRDGHLHPVHDEHGRPWFDPAEVEAVVDVAEDYRSILDPNL